MSDDEVSETVIVHLPRWSLGPWRWGPMMAARLTVSYHPTYGFSSLIVELNVPDRNKRFLSVIVPIRHTLLERYQGRERITSQHRRQRETDRITAGTAGPTPPTERTATHPEPRAVEESKPTTTIFRMPKEDVSTRITRLRDKRLSSIPPSSTPAWSNALEMSNPFLVVETEDAGQDLGKPATPTYTVVAKPTTAATTSSVFRMDKEDISERLERCRRSDVIGFPLGDAGGETS